MKRIFIILMVVLVIVSMFSISFAKTFADVKNTKYELMNYKIVLSKPNDDMVPDYFKDEQDDLNGYYKEVYDQNGIFGKNFLNSYLTFHSRSPYNPA